MFTKRAFTFHSTYTYFWGTFVILLHLREFYVINFCVNHFERPVRCWYQFSVLCGNGWKQICWSWSWNTKSQMQSSQNLPVSNNHLLYVVCWYEFSFTALYKQYVDVSLIKFILLITVFGFSVCLSFVLYVTMCVSACWNFENCITWPTIVLLFILPSNWLNLQNIMKLFLLHYNFHLLNGWSCHYSFASKVYYIKLKFQLEYFSSLIQVGQILACIESVSNMWPLLYTTNKWLPQAMSTFLTDQFTCFLLSSERWTFLYAVYVSAFWLIRLIVVAEKQVVYKKFPIPLINRLEKHILAMVTMLEPWQKELVKTLDTWVQRLSTVDIPKHLHR